MHLFTQRLDNWEYNILKKYLTKFLMKQPRIQFERKSELPMRGRSYQMYWTVDSSQQMYMNAQYSL